VRGAQDSPYKKLFFTGQAKSCDRKVMWGQKQMVLLRAGKARGFSRRKSTHHSNSANQLFGLI